MGENNTMHLTYHIQLRYVQRIKGVKNERDAATYLSQHKYEIFYQIHRMINESTLIYERFSPEGTGATYNYYLFGVNTLIVQSYNSKEWVTLYPIELESDARLNEDLIRSYMRYIHTHCEKINKLQATKQVKDVEAAALEFHYCEMVDMFGENPTDEKIYEHIRKMSEKTQGTIKEAMEATIAIRDVKRDIRRILDKLLFGFKERLEEEKTVETY